MCFYSTRVIASNAKKHKPPKAKAKAKTTEGKKDLTNIRVIQRRMAYVIGLPLSLADENVRTFFTDFVVLIVALDLNHLHFFTDKKHLVVFCSSYRKRNFLGSMARLLRFLCLGWLVGLFSSLSMTHVVCKLAGLSINCSSLLDVL